MQTRELYTKKIINYFSKGIRVNTATYNLFENIVESNIVKLYETLKWIDIHMN